MTNKSMASTSCLTL